VELPLSEDEEGGTTIADLFPGSGGGTRAQKIPLLPTFAARGSAPDHLVVTRIDPPDGFLGTVELACTVDALADRFGGRVLSVEARTADGTLIARSTKHYKIAREPREPKEPTHNRALAVSAAAPITEQQLLLARVSMDERIKMMRDEIDARETKKAADAEREMRRLQEQHRLSQEDSDRRLSRELERERQRNEQALQAQREHAAQQLAMVNASNTAVMTILQESSKQQQQLFASLFASKGEAKDPLETAVALVQVLSQMQGPGGEPNEKLEAFKALTGTVSEGFRAMGAAKQLPQTAARRVANGGGTAGRDPEKSRRIKSKVAGVLRELAKRGHDPEASLDMLHANLDSLAPAQGGDAGEESEQRDEQPQRATTKAKIPREPDPEASMDALAGEWDEPGTEAEG
jgi:hypothetical protein